MELDLQSKIIASLVLTTSVIGLISFYLTKNPLRTDFLTGTDTWFYSPLGTSLMISTLVAIMVGQIVHH